MLRRFIIACGAAHVAAGLWLGFRPFDDTYITFRYALNLAAGLGFVYNIGQPVLGTTSPLWAMVLAAIRITHIPIETGALVLSLCFDMAAAIFLWRWLKRLEYPPPVAAGAAILFLSWFDFLSIARSGMEASMFVFLVIATIDRLVSRRFVSAAAGCALACLTRPEGTLLLALFAATLWLARGSLRRGELLASAMLFGVVCGGWAVFAVHTFGSVVPQSLVAKASTSLQPALVRFSWANVALFFLKGQYGGDVFARTYVQMMPAVTLLAAAGAGSLVLDAFRHRAGLPLWRGMALLVFPVGYVGGLALAHAFTYFPWYYAPIYPFAAALAIIGAGAVWRGNQRPVIATCAALVAAQVTAAVLVKLPADRDFWVAGYFSVSDAVPRRQDVTVAAPEIGAVGWRVWPATILDLEGLVTPGAVRRAPEDYLRDTKPQYLILRTDNAQDLLERLEHGGWFLGEYELTGSRRDAYADREFRTYRRRH